MKRILTTTLTAAALLTITGCGATTAPTATPATHNQPFTTQQAQPLVDEPPAECQEDEPCWDCQTMGNRICGPNQIQELEAWASFQPEALPAEVRNEPFKVTYRGTALPVTNFPPPAHLTIPSTVTPAAVHVFEVQTPTPPTTCQEDEPCWDCKSMGNLICGTPAPTPTPAPACVPPTRTAEDGSCVNPDFWIEPISCADLQLGDGGTTVHHNCIPVPTSPAVYVPDAVCDVLILPGVTPPACATPKAKS